MFYKNIDSIVKNKFAIFIVFNSREYRLFWIGALFSNLGVWALMSGRLWLMQDLTHSTLMLGILTFSGSAPILLFSMWGGVLADRVNRLKIITFTRLMFAFASILTGILITTDMITPLYLIIISIGTGILFSIDIPSRQAILGNIVPKQYLLYGITMYSFIFGISGLAGPAYFAPIVKIFRLDGLFYFVGITYILTVLMLISMKHIPNPIRSEKNKIFKDLLEGWIYVKDHRIILTLICISTIITIFGTSFMTLLPAYAENIIQKGIEGYSNLLFGSGIGALLGGGMLVLFGNLKNSSKVQFICTFGLGISLILFSQSTWIYSSIFILIFVAGFNSAFAAINNTLIQSIVSEEFRGRVMSIHQMAWGTGALGGFMIGLIAQIYGIQIALMLFGSITSGVASILGIVVFKNQANYKNN